MYQVQLALHAVAAYMQQNAASCALSTLSSLQVKLVKFLVNDVVVDVSYETLGGLCAVNFLQELGMYIGRQDLFKRSVILVS